MSIKNTRLRLKDIRAGITVYVSHPVYGIEQYKILSKPYMNGTIGLFVKSIMVIDGITFPTGTMSLDDAGITPGKSYNGRRTFTKLKQALRWMEQHSKDKQFIIQQERLEKSISDWDEWVDEL